jgi:hypothetical protein
MSAHFDECRHVTERSSGKGKDLVKLIENESSQSAPNHRPTRRPSLGMRRRDFRDNAVIRVASPG